MNDVSLRDYFAGQVLNGLSATVALQSAREIDRGDERKAVAIKAIADDAYALADAMLRAREGQP